MISVNNIWANYQEQNVLKEISFKANASELITLLGPSGAGKSTLLKVIAGLHPEAGGHIVVNDKTITSLPPEQRGIVYLSQTPALFPHMNVEENMMFGLSIKRHDKRKAKEKMARLIEVLGLSGLEKRNAWELSGGQQQRVALGRALAIDPKVLLLDEPFSSLDVTLRQNLRMLIREICDKYQVTIIMVTHDPNEALAISDKILLMKDGMVIQDGTIEEVYRHPVNASAADILGTWGSLDHDFYRPSDLILLKDASGYEILEVSREGTMVKYLINYKGKHERLITHDIIPLNVGDKVVIHKK